MDFDRWMERQTDAPAPQDTEPCPLSPIFDAGGSLVLGVIDQRSGKWFEFELPFKTQHQPKCMTRDQYWALTDGDVVIWRIRPFAVSSQRFVSISYPHA